DCPLTDFGGKTSIFSHPVYLFLRKFSLQDSRGGSTGGGNCPDCGAVMGDATYQETFDEEYQVEVQEDDPEEMEGAEHPHKENTGGNQHHNSDNETGETADHPIKVNGHHEITSTSRTCDHLMIDLETMGKNPDAPIISIGAIFFD
ncbi:3'-5' exoribonuclease domain-containing protein, partial [Escherichia coli]